MRIAAQLVDDSGVQVWSNAYDRELRGIFAIQREIAEAVATNVVPKIVARSPVEPEPQPNLEAYQYYLAGRGIFDRRLPRYWRTPKNSSGKRSPLIPITPRPSRNWRFFGPSIPVQRNKPRKPSSARCP